MENKTPITPVEDNLYKKRVRIVLFAVVVILFAIAWIPGIFWTNYLAGGISIVVIMMGYQDRLSRVLQVSTIFILGFIVLRILFPENFSI